MKQIFTLLLSIFLFSFASNSQMRYLKGNLQASQEVPPTVSFAGGVNIVKYNMATKFLEFFGNYRNLTAPITASHIHVAPPGVANPTPLIPLTNSGGTTGTLTGNATLTAAQEADLLAGNMYANVHTSTYPGGEIRAQLTTTTAGQTVHLTARMQGAQEEPPNASPAMGIANALVDMGTNMLHLTGNYSGLTAPASGAHLHRAPPNVVGPVSIPLIFTPATSGTIDTTAVISVTLRDSILSGNSYANIHTSTFPDGEIRGQLLATTQLRFIAGSLSGANQVPPTTTNGRGTVVIRYNTETNLLEFVGDYQNLTATATEAHIHGPAGPTATAAVLENLTISGGTMGTITDTITLTEGQEVDLLAGNLYVDVHSTGTYATSGEIRTQLIPLSSGETQYLTAALDVDEERLAMPSITITSTGIGTAVAVLDKITRNIYLTGSYSNLSSGIINAHIHRGPVAVSGPVSINLQFIPLTTSGTVTGSATNIRATLMDSIINGSSYVNIHSTNYPGGEIRGQLGNLVLPVKLTYFNGFKDRNQVALIWESAQEINIKGYEVEQQNIATGQWIKKGTVASNGGNTSLKYRFDDIPTIGSKEYLLYRLKMVDIEGRGTYSSIIRINYSQLKAGLTITPNPVVNGKLGFTITGLSRDQKAEISIADFNGRIILRTAASTLSNNMVDVSRLSSGMYKLIIKTGDTVLQQSFSKQ